MDEKVKNQLLKWAQTYNIQSFIKDDPVQFPHRFSKKQDIEISGFLTSWISYGRRELILRKADWLHERMGSSPHEWIMEKGYKTLPSLVSSSGRETFYRFYTFSDLRVLCARLNKIYAEYDSLEDALAVNLYPNPIHKLQDMFAGVKGIPVMNGTSACKRLAMFLRWMVRRDGIVDFGIWQTAVHPHQLIIPLDTHVHSISLELGLTEQKSASLKTAVEITEALSRIFPNDPCLGDFALFGYDINKKKNI
ncbi:TIGR02757 family protein [Parabacteroides sp. AM08-6]|uniref:TIGR02757 family protein n=1 Tax=Parabacteroides sp. AM08-6 TaxID=2292053 RepID=UPI000F0004F6|nr:TIGR02757 family protein [Parabacteroides sp. AM08-6]RHJ77015.1 TIGR02757 family protein [Parabacteroides sp. AM08-6]